MKLELANCNLCDKEFKLDFRKRYKLRHGLIKNVFCSRECADKHLNKKVLLPCHTCGKVILKDLRRAKKSKSGFVFCSLSCSTSYANSTSPKVLRRSSIELYVEEKIKEDFPELEMLCSPTDIIGQELDFYFPTLKLALEINGPFHYLPIMGDWKLRQIQLNDFKKYKKCLEQDISLLILDVRTFKGLTKKNKERYYPQVKEALEARLDALKD